MKYKGPKCLGCGTYGDHYWNPSDCEGCSGQKDKPRENK